MKVMSLFDGMSCGRLALDRAGLPITRYFASEIDKYAIQIAKKNYPDTIHLGDVRDVWWPETFEGEKIDLLLGGSPCQGFSYAGKGLNFDDPRSKLFFEYVRLLKEAKPRYFLLENVRMKQDSQDIISEYLGVEPVAINSSLVSAQNRYRLYWTNIPFEMPEDRGILLRDIIESGYADRDKSHCLDASYYKGGNANMLRSYIKKSKRQIVFGDGCNQVGIADDINGQDIIKRIYSIEGKSPTLTTMQGGHREPKIAVDDLHWRKLSPIECERLQTVPDNYTEGVSNTQRYKMLGNGWTVDVIASILKNLKK